MKRVGLRMSLVFFLTLIALAGSVLPVSASARGLEPQDRVAMDFTCRFENGPVVASTQEEVIEDTSAVKSSLFIEPKQTGPVDVTAGVDNFSPDSSRMVLNFEQYIINELAQRIPGMRVGSRRTVRVSAAPLTHLAHSNRVLPLAIVRQRPRQVTMTRDGFEQQFPMEPAVGVSLDMYTYMVCLVTQVDQERVSYECTPEHNGTFMSEFGPAHFEEADDGWKMILDVTEGDLVRLVEMVGRITDVSDDVFKLDFTHPFGGRTLVCDVELQSLQGMTAGQVQAQEGKRTKTVDSVNESSGSLNDDKASSLSRAETRKDAAEPGDLVKASYTVRTERGKLVATTHQDVAQDEKFSRAKGYIEASHFGPQLLVAGKEAEVPGLGQALLGVGPGQAKQVDIPPEQAFGAYDQQKVVPYPRIKKYDRVLTLQPKDFVVQFNEFPEENATFEVNKYLTGHVQKSQDREVTVSLDPKKASFQEAIGKVVISEEDDVLTFRLDPELGSTYTMKDKTGVVSSMEETKFYVDFNHPLAGETLQIDLQVLELTKAAVFDGKAIDWIENHDHGLDMAAQSGKPIVMVLYSKTCPWCERLINNTLTDPRITMVEDDYVWVKVELSEKRELADRYELTSYPLTVFMSPEGEVVSKVSGFRKPGDFRREMIAAFEGRVARTE